MNIIYTFFIYTRGRLDNFKKYEKIYPATLAVLFGTYVAAVNCAVASSLVSFNAKGFSQDFNHKTEGSLVSNKLSIDARYKSEDRAVVFNDIGTQNEIHIANPLLFPEPSQDALSSCSEISDEYNGRCCCCFSSRRRYKPRQPKDVKLESPKPKKAKHEDVTKKNHKKNHKKFD